MYSYSSEFLILCVILACISTLSSSLVILAHVKIPQLRKHPGQMIVIISIIQIVYDLHWIAILKTLRDDAVRTNACYYFGIIFNLLIFFSWNVLTCLVLELIIKVHSPLSTNYNMRNKIYFIFIILVTVAELTPMIIFGGFGLTTIDTCFVKDGSKSYWFALGPVFVNVPLIFTGVIILMCSAGYRSNKALRKLIRACFSMCIAWGFPIFTTGTINTLGQEYIIMNYMAFIIGSCSGLILAISRLGSVDILKRVIRIFWRPKKDSEIKGINEVLIEGCSVNKFFEEFTEIVLKEILLMLSLALVTEKVSLEKYSCGYKKIKYDFEESDYDKLRGRLTLSSFLQPKKGGIWEYGQDYFSEIRNSCNINKENIFYSICSDENLKLLNNRNSAGRSGAFIFVTFNNEFVIKIIKTKERYFLLDILPSYAKRVTKSPQSKIVRILGMFKMRNSKQCFIVMENIIRNQKNSFVFDIKGSLDNRFVKSGPDQSGVVLKDENFLQMNKKVGLSKEQTKEFLSALGGDLQFFMRHNIIDYSLLLVIDKENNNSDLNSRYTFIGTNQYCYSLGIIDFLQEYSIKKKLEFVAKKIRGKENTSVCSPGTYSTRFLTFIRQSVLLST